ncbi:phospholipid phosphatase [Bacteroidia bacterium]|nr:phospholipid phosphatase [Bacteroidia bacterium]
MFIGNAILSQAQTSDTCCIVVDSVAQTTNHKSFLKTKDVIGIAIPVAMITYGIISIESDALKKLDYSTRNELLEDNSMWYNRWDDYFQFSPAVLAFGLKLSGVEGKHKLSDMFILYCLSNILESGFIYTIKYLTGRKRPDGSNYHSFPSGHTATAFVAAEFLYQEYKDQSVWISVGGYGMATLIGISRVYNNKHWVSDVVAGAGIGILSTKIVYWAYPSLQNLFSGKNKKYQALMCPSYENGALGLNFSCTF